MQRSLALVILLAACGPSSRAAAPAGPATTDPTTDPTTAPADPPVEAPPVEVPAVEVTAALEDGQIRTSAPWLYQTGGAALTDDSAPVVAAVARLLADKPDLTLVRIEVHSDNTGDGGANQALTEARALAAARALVAAGVDCHRLIPVGFGDTKPVESNATLAGRAANRRTELHPAALRGHLIGGMPADGGGAVAGDPCAP